jgi:tetratricopeptide (TPR) repeat protein
MAKKVRAGSKHTAPRAAPEEIKETQAPAPKAKTLFEKVIIFLIVAALAVVVYEAVDYQTGWGNPGKVLKRAMDEAEKDAIYKRYDAAIRIYDRIIARWGKDEKFKDEIKQANLSLAKTYKDSEKNMEAIELYKKLAEEYKTANRDMYAWLLLELGECYNAILNTQGAIASYNTVIAEFADTDWAAEALFGIAEAYKNKKDYGNAVKYYDMIVSKYKKGFLSAEALTNKGMILEELGRTKQALTVYEKVVKEFPDIVTEYAKLRVGALSGLTEKK